jgi:hypothetical protein
MTKELDSFKSLEISDRQELDPLLRQFKPKVSELTFTNLFMWRRSNKPAWKIRDNFLFLVFRPDNEEPYGLKPVGAGDTQGALDYLWDVLGQVSDDPRICRADEEFVERFAPSDKYSIEDDRDNSDYVYKSDDLINLSGNRFHSKKNHLNKFKKTYEYEYRDLGKELVDSVLELQEEWCRLKECEYNPGLRKEDTAIYEALTHYEELGCTGGAILIDSKVQAYTLGELLNDNTAVIHVEKANPEISGAYVAINNFFVSANWEDTPYVNREQDLGVPGIRKAKESYNPEYMVDKYTIRPRG